MSEFDALLDRGLQAVEDDNIVAARAVLAEAEAGAGAGEGHARVLHLKGLVAWADGDLEEATTALTQAVDLKPERGDVYLDCAECLFEADEIEDAQAQVRALLALPDLPGEQADDARLLLAQLRLAADDPADACAVLEEIDPARKAHAAFLGTLGAAQLVAKQFEAAVTTLRTAVETAADDADIQYQLGIALLAVGKEDEARAAMVKVLELDRTEWSALGEDMTEKPDFAEVQELRSRVEDVLEGLPDPVLKLVAAAPITVQTRPTPEQVTDGVDPRGTIAFLGAPKTDDEEADLKGIVVMRDLVLGAVDDDDEIEEELFYGVLEQLQQFFRRDDMIVAEA